jgi:hypothetical protein
MLRYDLPVNLSLEASMFFKHGGEPIHHSSVAPTLRRSSRGRPRDDSHWVVVRDGLLARAEQHQRDQPTSSSSHSRSSAALPWKLRARETTLSPSSTASSRAD